MSDSATIIHDRDTSHRLQISHRDWMLICGPGFAEGPAFSDAFGIFENYTVAGGIPGGTFVHRQGRTLFDATTTLLQAIKRDYKLMGYDYSYKIGEGRKQYGGGQGISVNGRPGILSLRPKGYCSIEFVDKDSQPLLPAILDLRAADGFVTDAGPVKIYRRKAKSLWLEILPPLLTFLGTRLTTQLRLEHIDRVG